MSNTPNHQIPYVPEGALDPAAGLNLSLDDIDALLPSGVISIGDTVPPVSPTNGDLYIVGASATGAWAGLDYRLVRYVAEGAFWKSYVPGTQVVLVLNNADEGLYTYRNDSNGPAWVLAAGIGDAPSDGTTYGRKDGAWIAVAGGGGSIAVVGIASNMTTVDPCTEIQFSGAVEVTDLGGGVAGVAVTGGGGGGGGGDANVTPDTHPTTPDAADDEFEVGTTLDTTGARFSGATAWAWRNQGGGTFAQANGIGVLTGTGQTTPNHRIIEQTVSGSAWKYRAKMTSVTPASETSQFSACGMMVFNTGNSRVVTFCKGTHINYILLGAVRWTSVTAFSADIGTGKPIGEKYWGPLGQPQYLEIELAAGVLTFRYSFDGQTWIDYGTTETVASFLSAVDRIGLVALNDGTSNVPKAGFDWFRRIS